MPNNANQVPGTIYELSFLIKLIPETFDGDRYKIRSFIKQIDGVFELAAESQKPALLLYVKSRISGKAREQVDIHCNLTTWEGVSDLLLNLYQDRKSLDQLFEELNSMTQRKNENVSQFFQRIEDLSSRILAAIHTSEQDASLLPGSTAMVTKMTLNRFIYHTHPQISQMLRYREFQTINQAFSAASAEEKALRIRYEQFSRCTYCSRTNHASEDCYQKNSKSNPPVSRYSRPIHFAQQNQNFRKNNFQNPRKNSNHLQNSNRTYDSRSNQNSHCSTDQTQCRYCKNMGHTIDECIKRFAANVRRNKIGGNRPDLQNVQHSSVHLSNQNFQLPKQNSNPPERTPARNDESNVTTHLSSFTFHNVYLNNSELTFVLFESPSSNSLDGVLKFLIDTGASVSSVKRSSLRTFEIINPEPIMLNGINVNKPIATLGET
ncbi:hypothetical protein ANTQUA_LOCUS9577 [Anthophora quadrimaculata]